MLLFAVLGLFGCPVDRMRVVPGGRAEVVPDTVAGDISADELFSTGILFAQVPAYPAEPGADPVIATFRVLPVSEFERTTLFPSLTDPPDALPAEYLAVWADIEISTSDGLFEMWGNSRVLLVDPDPAMITTSIHLGDFDRWRLAIPALSLADIWVDLGGGQLTLRADDTPIYVREN